MGMFVDASEFGFSPDASGAENAAALQKALDQGGTITVARPGIYKLARTVYIGSHTTLIFGDGVMIQKSDEEGPFTHVILNKGALSKVYDRHIRVDNLHIAVNGVDRTSKEVFGLRGQLAFFCVRDLRIERFRCLDLARGQYAIHICTFEDLLIRDAIIKGEKDGIHLGRGRRFHISGCVFETYDDAIALNAHDYDTGNPELGWIEDGVVENCHDLARGGAPDEHTGFFCRILAGGWTDWRPGMKVQKSDTVVSGGRLYRVQAEPDGRVFVSRQRPTHESGTAELDGIRWTAVQEEVTYTAGVRNVTFRNIFLHKARPGFSVHFDNDHYSRSYYPGAPVPVQEQIILDNVRVLHDRNIPLLTVNTPVDAIVIANSSLRNNGIRFHGNQAMDDYGTTRILMNGCIFNHDGVLDLVENEAERKRIELKTAASLVMHSGFSARLSPGPGSIRAETDLPVHKD